MHSLRNDLGEEVARLDSVALGDALFALLLDWKGDRALPPTSDGSSALQGLIDELKGRGGRTFVTRIITAQSNRDSTLTDRRSSWHRTVLQELGFQEGEERVEYRLPLAHAIEALGRPPAPEAPVEPEHSGDRGRPVEPRRPIASTLTWIPVATEPGPELERAAGILSGVAPKDPDLNTVDAARGFLLARKEDSSLVLTPECIQIGQVDGADAAIVIPSVAPGTGWCSLYYMGVLPAFRGRGLGTEVMQRGFEIMESLGGKTYHDGTGAENAAALALFARFGVPPYRRMEEWSLGT
ncbi:MAG: GNAT family N-acetyltransferase [Candidatus Eisenbacteria bacterium]